MSWIEGIFGLRKTEKELECEQRISTFNHSLELRGMLRKDLEEFRDRFRTGSVLTNPALYRMGREFGHTDIDRLSLIECCMLGFSSRYITRGDLNG